jgi:hypothetical protein
MQRVERIDKTEQATEDISCRAWIETGKLED